VHQDEKACFKAGGANSCGTSITRILAWPPVGKEKLKNWRKKKGQVLRLIEVNALSRGRPRSSHRRGEISSGRLGSYNSKTTERLINIAYKKKLSIRGAGIDYLSPL